MDAKPTIAELEAILNDPTPHQVYIQADGQVRARKIEDMTELRRDISTAINRVSAESGSNTPDFILAEYLTDCLTAYDKAVFARDRWTAGNPVPWLSP